MIQHSAGYTGNRRGCKIETGDIFRANRTLFLTAFSSRPRHKPLDNIPAAHYAA